MTLEQIIAELQRLAEAGYDRPSMEVTLRDGGRVDMRFRGERDKTLTENAKALSLAQVSAARLDLLASAASRLTVPMVNRRARTDLVFRALDACRRTVGALDDPQADHVRTMFRRIPELIDSDLDKAMRWLGFVQGWLWARGLATVDELKDMNREPTP